MISECLVFADLFTNQSYLASPFISQPLFIAACAFIHDARVNHNVSLDPLKTSAESNDPLSVPANVHGDKGELVMNIVFMLTNKLKVQDCWVRYPRRTSSLCSKH